MSTYTINISEKTATKFSIFQLENFVNSEKFEDLVLGFNIMKWETWKTQSFSSFKKELLL